VIYQRLGIPTVAQVSWTTDQIMRRLFPEQLVTEWTDPTGSFSLVERMVPAGWAGRKLTGLLESDRFHVVSLTRGSEVRLLSTDLVAQEGDILHVAVRKDAIEELESKLSGTPQGAHA